MAAIEDVRQVEHTPGPWHVERDGTMNPTIRVENGGTIAKLIDSNPSIFFDHEANARLIAAAPDLLAALESAIEQIEGMGIEEWAGAEGLDLAAARAALTLARGEGATRA